MGDIFNVLLLQNTLRTATPVVLAALGCLMTQHVNITNIGIDGMMLIGAFFAVVGSYFTGSWVGGLALAMVIGVVLGLFYYLFVIKFKSDEFIIGVALNIFAGGLTTFLLRTLTGQSGTFHADGGLSTIPRLSAEWLNGIPVIGPLLNDNTVLVYVSWILVIVSYLLIYKTPLGFWLRASGEHPNSLRSAGRSPAAMQYLASLACGMLAGLAGAHLSLGYLSTFSENMTNSRGFIAVACVIFGRAHPVKAFLAALMFGFIDALGMRLQSFEISSALTSMLPYIGTVVMMVLLVVRDNAKKKKLARG